MAPEGVMSTEQKQSTQSHDLFIYVFIYARMPINGSVLASLRLLGHSCFPCLFSPPRVINRLYFLCLFLAAGETNANGKFTSRAIF